MIFSEIYSAYYNAVAKIIGRVLEGGADERELERIVREHAFGESLLTLLPSLKSEKWQLLRADLTTPLRRTPTMPLTLIQKQWLKAITLDPRIRLFGVELAGLEGVEPLFTPEDIFLYDKYGDGDPYEEAGYIERFGRILAAIREQKPLRLELINRRGRPTTMVLRPRRLEYSEKDDKFRLIGDGCRYGGTVNLARLISCTECTEVPFSLDTVRVPEQRTLTLRIRDERNTPERCMLHFAHFEKQAEREDEHHCLVHIRYDRDDEPELIIRVLSFGPLVEVLAPECFRKRIIEKLKSQKSCEL